MLKKKTFHNGKVCVATAIFVLFAQAVALSVETQSMMVDWGKQKLEYRVSLPKTTFFLYEPVLAELWTKNPSGDTVRIWTRTRWEDWVLRDQSGKYYDLRTHALAFPAEIVIAPGDSFGGPTDLRRRGATKVGQLYPYDFLPLGEYQLSYRVDENVSAPISFKIVEPSGKEAEALKAFLDAYWPSRRGEEFERASPKERSQLFVQTMKRLIAFVDEFPNSVYAVAALEVAAIIAWMNAHDGELFYRIQIRLMREYGDPSNGTVSSLRLYYLEGKKDTATFRSVADSIIQKGTNPRLKFEAKKALKNLNELRAKE